MLDVESASFKLAGYDRLYMLSNVYFNTISSSKFTMYERDNYIPKMQRLSSTKINVIMNLKFFLSYFPLLVAVSFSSAFFVLRNSISFDFGKHFDELHFQLAFPFLKPQPLLVKLRGVKGKNQNAIA